MMMTIPLLLTLFLATFLLLALGFYGDFKPAPIAMGAILLTVTGLLIGMNPIQIQTGTTLQENRTASFTYQNYSVKENANKNFTLEPVNESIEKSTETTQKHQGLNDNANTFLSAGLILTGLALFTRLIFSFLHQNQA